MFRTAVCSLLLLVALGISGCATGPAFKTEEVPPGKAVIYIYRPPTMWGAALTPSVVIDKLNAIQLTVGGYYPYVADPGQRTIALIHTGRMAIDLPVKAGETYYVRATLQVMGTPFIEAFSPDAAVPELKECKRLPPVAGVPTTPMPASP